MLFTHGKDILFPNISIESSRVYFTPGLPVQRRFDAPQIRQCIVHAPAAVRGGTVTGALQSVTVQEVQLG